MKKVKLFPALLAAALLIGCGKQAAAPNIPEPSAEGLVSAETVPLVTLSSDTLFSNRDLEGGVDLSKAVSITLTGSSAQTNAPGVGIDGGTITISQEGIYILSGTLEGQIIVDADKSNKVQLVLNGVNITSPSSAAIYAKKADKVFLTLAENTDNLLSNSGSFTAVDDTSIDSVIYSKVDLTLNGAGSLTVDSPAGHGIVSKDELVITSGTYRLNASQHGMTGKDCISIAGGTFQITAGEDGIHAKHSDDASAGFVFIGGGSFEIQAGQDGISATGALQIDDGSFVVTTGGGSEAVAMRPSDGMSRNQNGSGFYGSTVSAKGLKADSTILISGGGFQLDCADDAIHAGGDIQIKAGSFQLRTADDGIHSDQKVTIDGGDISLPYCYEGIEGQAVTVNNGTISIVSQDDGINAAGGMDNSGMDFRGWNPGSNDQQPPEQPDGAPMQKLDHGQRGEGGKNGGMGRGGFGGRGSAADSSAVITINGGSITIESQGDSLDSNGSILLTGGTLDLTCAGFGNTAIDCDGSFTNSGAKVTTNDGSENGTMFTQRGSR